MAIEGTYKELAAGFDLTKTVNGITATRQFIDSYPGATDSLPEMGDTLDATDDVLKTVVVTSIRETYYGNDCTQKLYVVSYSNSPGTSDNPDNPTNSDPDELPISGGLSGESLNIDGEKDGVKEKWVWKGTETPCDQQLFKTITTGTFRITRRLASLELDTWAEYCGTINNASFKVAGSSFAQGLVMFNGAEYEEYRNSKGERRFKVGFTFTVKKMRAAIGDVFVGWNYFFDPITDAFREVVNVDTLDNLYQEVNLGLLLAGTEEP
jgi:hypothetical protein